MKTVVSNMPVKALLSSWDAAVGKTLFGVIEETSGYKELLVFRFTDKTALVLSYSDESGFLYPDPETFDGNYGGDRYARVYFGIDSVEAYEREEQEAEDRNRAKREAAERETYLRLKAKFAEEGVQS